MHRSEQNRRRVLRQHPFSNGSIMALHNRLAQREWPLLVVNASGRAVSRLTPASRASNPALRESRASLPDGVAVVVIFDNWHFTPPRGTFAAMRTPYAMGLQKLFLLTICSPVPFWLTDSNNSSSSPQWRPRGPGARCDPTRAANDMIGPKQTCRPSCIEGLESRKNPAVQIQD